MVLLFVFYSETPTIFPAFRSTAAKKPIAQTDKAEKNPVENMVTISEVCTGRRPRAFLFPCQGIFCFFFRSTRREVSATPRAPPPSRRADARRDKAVACGRFYERAARGFP